MSALYEMPPDCFILLSKGSDLVTDPDAQRRATARYNEKTYDRIEIRVKKGRKEEIFTYARSQNKSVTQLIVDLLEKEMNQH